MNRIPLLHEIARSASISFGNLRRAMTREQLAAQDELRARSPELANIPGSVILPFRESRGVTTSVDGGGHNSSGKELVGVDVPEYGAALRANLVLERLGARVLEGLVSDVQLPQAAASITAEWLPEVGANDEDTIEFIGSLLKPRRIGAWVDVSQQLLRQGVAAEASLRSDLMAALAEALQDALIRGTGTGNEPLGILNTDGVALIEGGANGAEPSVEHLAELEESVIDRGHLGWLVSPRVRRKLRLTEYFAGGGHPVWPKTEANKLLGHPAGVTGSIPDTLTKGTANGTASALVFGEFSELFILLWGPGIAVQANPYTRDTEGVVRLTAYAYVNGGLRDPAAFAVMRDALAA